MAPEPPDSPAVVGALAAHTLEDLYASVCGEPPLGAHAWRDGATLLLVLAPGEGAAPLPDYAALPAQIAAAVRARTGCELRGGRWSSDRELGLEMFVFRLPSASGARARGGEAADRRVPAWQRWSPVPAGGLPRSGRRHGSRMR